MKKLLLGLFLLTTLFSCDDRNQTTNDKIKMKVTLELIPEDDSSYSLTWIDTIGLKNNDTEMDRPIELWCIVKNQNDTVGYYQGLSSPMNFTYFTTKDSIVDVFFMTGYNWFSEKVTEEYVRINGKPITFAPIYINTKTDLRRKLEFVLIED